MRPLAFSRPVSLAARTVQEQASQCWPLPFSVRTYNCGREAQCKSSVLGLLLSSARPRHLELARGRLHCDIVLRLAGLASSILHVLVAAGETLRALTSSCDGVLAPQPASPALLCVLTQLRRGKLDLAEAAGPPQF